MSQYVNKWGVKTRRRDLIALLRGTFFSELLKKRRSLITFEYQLRTAVGWIPFVLDACDRSVVTIG